MYRIPRNHTILITLTHQDHTLSNWLDRETFSQLSKKSDWKACGIFIAQSLLYLGWLVGASADYSPILNILFSLSAGFVIGQLFVIGHDACHQALAKHIWLNNLIGRLCFLASHHSYSLWRLEHNIKHHQHTNIKSLDPSWCPLSKDEFDQLPTVHQWLERIYRSAWGGGLYYMLEMWIKNHVCPFNRDARRHWWNYLPDSLLVISAAILQLILILKIGIFIAPSKPSWELLLLTWVIPFLSWNWIMGFVIYLHHTHPQIIWYSKDPGLGRSERQVDVTAHVIFPAPINALLYNIMDHTAHHLKSSLPLFSVGEAQHKLEQSNPGRIFTYRWSLTTHMQITNACKLYNFQQHCWTDFNGIPTANPIQASDVTSSNRHQRWASGS